VYNVRENNWFNKKLTSLPKYINQQSCQSPVPRLLNSYKHRSLMTLSLIYFFNKTCWIKNYFTKDVSNILVKIYLSEFSPKG